MRIVFVSRCNPAVVPDYQVITVVSRDRVAKTAANDDIIAVAGVDDINAAVSRRGSTLDQVYVARVQVRARYCAVTFLTHIIDPAIIAKDHVVALAHVNLISTVSAQDDVIARPGGNRVVSAVTWLYCLDQT